MASNQASRTVQSIGTDLRVRTHEPTGSDGRGEKGTHRTPDAPPLDEKGQPGTLLRADWWKGRARAVSSARLDTGAVSCDETEESESERVPQRKSCRTDLRRGGPGDQDPSSANHGCLAPGSNPARRHQIGRKKGVAKSNVNDLTCSFAIMTWIRTNEMTTVDA